jgi:hypothetical protein
MNYPIMMDAAEDLSCTKDDGEEDEYHLSTVIGVKKDSCVQYEMYCNICGIPPGTMHLMCSQY